MVYFLHKWMTFVWKWRCLRVKWLGWSVIRWSLALHSVLSLSRGSVRCCVMLFFMETLGCISACLLYLWSTCCTCLRSTGLAFSWWWHCSCGFECAISSPSQVAISWLIVNHGCCGDCLEQGNFQGDIVTERIMKELLGFVDLLWVQLCYLKSCIFPLFSAYYRFYFTCWIGFENLLQQLTKRRLNQEEATFSFIIQGIQLRNSGLRHGY